MVKGKPFFDFLGKQTKRLQKKKKKKIKLIEIGNKRIRIGNGYMNEELQFLAAPFFFPCRIFL